MTRDELLQYHAELCTEARELMSLKNRDYAGSDGTEPFANFTRCEAMGICKTEEQEEEPTLWDALEETPNFDDVEYSENC